MRRSKTEDPCEMQGEGITRTADPGATQWPYVVRFDRGQPMSGTIAAIDRHQAQRFLENRHPLALRVTVLEQPKAKRRGRK